MQIVASFKNLDAKQKTNKALCGIVFSSWILPAIVTNFIYNGLGND